MALYHFKRIVRDSEGDAVPSVEVTVKQAGTETNATIYSDSGGTAKANPFTAEADGRYSFFVDEGAEIDLDFAKAGFTIASENGITVPWITTSAPSTRTISTTAPLTGGGDLSADRTLALDQSAIDHGAIAGLGDDDHPQYGLLSDSESVTGTWSFARIQAKRPWADVKHPDFGAVGSGGVDDTAAIQAAIDNVEAAGGGVVFFPGGLYNVTSLIVNSKGVMLVGSGTEATRIRSTSTTGNVISIGNTAAAYSSAGGVRDLGIISSVTRTSGYAISVDGCQDGVIDNVRIQTTGGSGIQFGATSSSRWFVTRTIINMTGAFIGISIEGGNDRYITDVWVQGNQTAGSKAVQILDSAGDWLTNVEAVLCEIGIDLSAAAGKTIKWHHFTNVLADQNTLYGWRLVASGGTVQGITLNSPWSSSNGTGSTSSRGIMAQNCSGLVIVAPRVLNNGGHGIEVQNGVGGLLIQGGIVSGNSVASSGTLHGIQLGNNTTGYRILGVRSGQNAGMGNTQGYGILSGAGNDNFIVKDNDLRANVTGGFSNGSGTGATKIVGDNL